MCWRVGALSLNSHIFHRARTGRNARRNARRSDRFGLVREVVCRVGYHEKLYRPGRQNARQNQREPCPAAHADRLYGGSEPFVQALKQVFRSSRGGGLVRKNHYSSTGSIGPDIHHVDAHTYGSGSGVHRGGGSGRN